MGSLCRCPGPLATLFRTGPGLAGHGGFSWWRLIAGILLGGGGAGSAILWGIGLGSSCWKGGLCRMCGFIRFGMGLGSSGLSWRLFRRFAWLAGLGSLLGWSFRGFMKRFRWTVCGRCRSLGWNRVDGYGLFQMLYHIISTPSCF